MKTALVVAALMISSAATPAAAAVYGSAGWATLRNCNLVSAVQSCDGTGPGQFISQELLAHSLGPLVQDADFYAKNPFPLPPTLLADNWYRAGFSDPASWSFPTIKARTRAIGNVRTNVNVFAFQTYTNFDPFWAHPLDNDAYFSVWDSSKSPADDRLPNGAAYTFYVAWWDASLLLGLSLDQPVKDWFTRLFYIPCGTPGVMAVGTGSGTLSSAKFFSQTVGVSRCDGPWGASSLAPGRSAALVVGMQLPVNRGGWVDATHSLTIDWGESVTAEERARMRETFVPSFVSPVPEPAGWALILCGFAMAGWTLRRRRSLD
jgi:hypothetical protein